MKFVSINNALILAFCLFASIATARNPVNAVPRAHNGYKEEAGGCNIPADQFFMDVNNVRTDLLNAGDQWWNLSNGQYFVPKCDITSTATCPSAIFAGAIWVSALDIGNNLKIAALTYRQGTSDYFTGPLDNTGNVDLTQCNLWDMHFPVWSSQIAAVVNAYAAAGPGGHVSPSLIADSVLYWPGKGNPNLAAKGYDVSGVLAPFYDANGDGIYNPLDGDYPTIKQSGIRNFGKGCDSLINTCQAPSYADEMVFWVMNDKGNVHTASNGAPMGIQVNELAFAFIASDELNNMTFYTYNIINKSGGILQQTYMSQWADIDLGCANNDRVGCDTSRSMGIQYNGYVSGATQCPGGYTADEGTVCPTGEYGYGCDLPMAGIEYFEGPTDTTRINGVPKHLGMTSFVYFTNGASSCYTDPSTAASFRNYQKGLWSCGDPITFGGAGYGGSVQTNFVFPGDPSIATQWSECNTQSSTVFQAGDRRFVETSGPFTFLPCASEIITIGVVFVQPPGGVGTNCPSWSFIEPAADKAKALFDACFQELAGPSAPLLDIRAMDQKVIINIMDDPNGNNVGESYAQPDQLRVSKGFRSGSSEDSLYRFQGYVIYQLADATVSSSDLSNPAKAVPVAVMDIKDNVSHLVNWTSYSDPVTSTSAWTPNSQTIPGVGINLPNTGIVHSFVDSTDAIAGGKLINHLTYYYGVLSFATNNFQKFNPQVDTGQSEPFLIGKNFNKYSVVPENSTPTDGGRMLNSAWGSSAQVQRIEGAGNGGNYADLDSKTILGILSSSQFTSDTATYYLVGQDPIGLKVVDPVVLKEADFELVVYDTSASSNYNIDSAYWVLHDLTNNVFIPSVATLAKPYEQIIAYGQGNEYGFSVSLGTPFAVYTNQLNHQPIYGPIGGSITFADPSKPWLSFLADSGESIANNWIRTGTYSLVCQVPPPASGNDPLCNVFVSAYYKSCTSCPQIFTDPNNLYASMAGGKWAPYCLAANYSMAPTQAAVTNRPQSVGGPGFKWDRYDDKASSPQNNLDQLHSVDIVLTNDKSKWSQCVVFETGESPNLDLPTAPDGSMNPPRKGMLRNHYNMNIDSTFDNSGVGLSWFPGYAIDIETGTRLDIAFGEASDEANENGMDMIWNPTSTLFSTINQSATDPYVPFRPLFGGKHFIYVFNTTYGAQLSNVQPTLTTGQLPDGTSVYTDMVNTNVASNYSSSLISNVTGPIYSSIMWTAIPYLTPGYSMLSYADGLIPNEVTIRLRVNNPYSKYATSATSSSPTDSVVARYQFSTKGLGPKTNIDSVAVSALDMIRIVPNPYLAYSVYETSANDAEIKITNLPNNCSVKIYTLDGILVKTLSQSIKNNAVTNKPIEITDGYDLNSNGGSAALDNSIQWNLKNEANIPVASGIYLFDVQVPGVGHKILKWFGAVRPTDVSNF